MVNFYLDPLPWQRECGCNKFVGFFTLWLKAFTYAKNKENPFLKSATTSLIFTAVDS